jgi:hypothetical protein
MSGIIGLSALRSITEKKKKNRQTDRKRVCNEPLRVLSMILKFETLFKKSEARAA